MICKVDPEQRFVDPEVYSLRSRYLQLVRQFFLTEEFLEIDSPVMLPWAPAEPFLEPLDIVGGPPSYLATSPEFGLKTVWAHCLEHPELEKIFEISHAFRREEHSSPIHTFEFLMLEWYEYRANLNDMVYRFFDLWSQLLARFESRTGHSLAELEPQELAIDELMARHPFVRFDDPQSWIAYATDKSVGGPPNLWEAFSIYFLHEVEPILTKEKRIWSVSGFPSSLGAMARRKGPLAERVEIYFGGLELANIYLEETDPKRLRMGWEADNELRREMGRLERPIPEPFLHHWARLHTGRKNGLDQGCGAALGLDRLLMLLCGAASLGAISPYTRF